MAGRRLTWSRKHGPTEPAGPKDYDKARGLRGATYGPASLVRHIEITPELRAQYEVGLARVKPRKVKPQPRKMAPWSPWRELTADDRVPMTGEVYTAIAMGGQMWERRR